MAIDIPYLLHVRRVLIGADTFGISFRELYQKVKTPNHPGKDLRTILNAWKARKWVDEYDRIMPSGQHSKIWRATQRIFDEWPDVNNAVHALMYATGLPLGQPSGPDASQSRSDPPEP